MTTQATLNQDCRDLLGDPGATYFTDQQVHQWINDAILYLSNHFPLRKEYDISTSEEIRQYDLELSIISILTVEYPQGADPPVYLKRRSYTHPEFWSEDGYYDLIRRYDATSTNKSELWISNKPGGSETIRVEALYQHNTLSDPSDVTTILERHEHLIHLFVRWKAWMELATSEGMDPDPTELLSATHEVNAYRAERAFRKALEDVLSAETDTAFVHVRLDRFDRIY